MLLVEHRRLEHVSEVPMPAPILYLP
jgi:hypothetical protein